MAKADEVEKRFARSEEAGKWIIGIFLAWLGTGTGFLFSINGDVRAIKQSLKDHGSEIVQNISNPATTEVLAANLELASAQLRVVRSEHRLPDPDKLRALQNAIVKASDSHPDLGETWQAAAQLVSIKSEVLGPKSDELPPCDTAHAVIQQRYHATGEGRWLSEAGYFYANCTLNLDSLPVQDKKGTFHLQVLDDGRSALDKSEHILQVKILPSDDPLQVPIYVRNGIVRYNGGQIPSGNNQFVFENCKFDLSVRGIPSKPARELLLAGLKQPDTTDIKVGMAGV